MKTILKTIGISIAFLIGILLLTIGVNTMLATFGLWFAVPAFIACIVAIVYHVYVYVLGN
jgi:hypothetical protein